MWTIFSCFANWAWVVAHVASLNSCEQALFLANLLLLLTIVAIVMNTVLNREDTFLKSVKIFSRGPKNSEILGFLSFLPKDSSGHVEINFAKFYVLQHFLPGIQFRLQNNRQRVWEPTKFWIFWKEFVFTLYWSSISHFHMDESSKNHI